MEPIPTTAEPALSSLLELVPFEAEKREETRAEIKQKRKEGREKNMIKRLKKEMSEEQSRLRLFGVQKKKKLKLKREWKENEVNEK